MVDDTQIYRDLGRIGAQIDSLSNTIADMRKEDREYKEFLASKLELLEETAAGFKEAQPTIQNIRKWEERTIGALMLASSLSALVAAYGVDFLHYIRAKIGI